MIGTFLWIALAFLVVLGWLRIRARLRGQSRALDDEAVRRIIAEGRIRTEEDEPLDLDEIGEEEERFWEEDWEEPEEW